MKKITYLFAAVIMAASLFSCQQGDSDTVMLKKGAGNGPATFVVPPSAGGVVPQIIVGANNGGNVTCAEVAAAYGLPADYFHCGNKVDYSGGVFSGEFPDGLNVVVTDGKYVSFDLDEPILIGDAYYIIGAVIVKGGNAANVYYYPGGIMEDSGLMSPVNASGKPAGLSNLTFCLMKKLPEMVIALKTYLYPAAVNGYKEWASSRGEGSEINSLKIGYINYDYSLNKTCPLYYGSTNIIIGTITMTHYFESLTHYLEVKLDIDDGLWQFDTSYLYAGSAEGYYNSKYMVQIDGINYSQFLDFPFIETGIVEQRIFKIDFKDIVD